MVSKPFPALCKDCKFATLEKYSLNSLRCNNPVVNANDEWALSAGSSGSSGTGTSCHNERAVRWFAKCGMKGKLWASK